MFCCCFICVCMRVLYKHQNTRMSNVKFVVFIKIHFLLLLCARVSRSFLRTDKQKQTKGLFLDARGEMWRQDSKRSHNNNKNNNKRVFRDDMIFNNM